jgi:UDP-N-acetylmuramoylalanine--D-glutamate ligase
MSDGGSWLGHRLGVLGLGRSGLAVAKAAQAKGCEVLVFERSNRESIAKPEVLEEADQAGIDVRFGVEELPKLPDDIRYLVANPAVDMRSDVFRQATEQGVEILSEIEFAYRISSAPIVAVTGTNGKSTTAVMTYLCLLECGEPAVLCGNIFGSGYPEVPLTQAALDSTPNQFLVAEVSSFQLEWVDRFMPISGGITNITPDHQDRYDRFEDYARVKRRLLRTQTAGTYQVSRAGDSMTQIEPKTRAAVLTFGAVGEHAEVREDHLSILGRRIDDHDSPFHEPHNRLNAAMASLLAYGALAWRADQEPDSNAAALLQAARDEIMGRREARRTVFSYRPASEETERFLPEAIVTGLKQFRGLAHRMEHVGERDGVLFINNSMCTNPAAIISSASSLKQPKRLLIGGVNKGLDFRPVRGIVSSGLSSAYIFGKDREEIASSMQQTQATFATLEQAFAAAVQDVRRGDVVMLAPGCASTDEFRDFRHRGDVFRQLAKDWLER